MSNITIPFLPYIQTSKNISKYIIFDYTCKGLFTTNLVTLYKVNNHYEVLQQKKSLFKSSEELSIFEAYSEAFNFYKKLTKEFYL